MSKNATAAQRRTYSQRYRARHYDRVLERERQRRATPEGRAKQRAYYVACQSKPAMRIQNLIKKAKSRAAAKGLPCSDALFAKIKANPPTRCVCCGAAFDYSLDKGHNNASASFDRVDNTRGYVEGNLAVICRRCNRIKADATADELSLIAAYIRAHGDRNQCAA
jgi:hypothetical protein